MYKRILVPLDGSPFSQQALAYALGIAHRANATLHFVRVLTTPVAEPPAPHVLDSARNGRFPKAELGHLEELATLPRACGVDIRTAVLHGPIVEAIETYVEEAKIDLVIMTTHGRGGLSRMWLGSVADALVRNLDVPVLLLRSVCRNDYGTGFGVRHIVIPVDGSSWSEHAIDHAVNIGGLTDARYTLVQIVAPPVSLRNGLTSTRARDVALERLRAKTIACLDKVADRIRARGCEVNTAVIVQTQSAAGILEYAMECRADLIVMATHGYSGWTRMAIGSVADKVLRGTQVPLLLTRPNADICNVELISVAV
jgi:nucleotide-binding universal stress UspA family protein